jgi:GNAT superfamily N-acetyltransferase
MPTDDALTQAAAQLARRWRALDPLLPAPDPASRPHCGAPLAVGGDGALIAAGRCGHWAGEPGSLDLSWGAARRFQLFPVVPGPEVASGLDRLLATWRDHLAVVPGTGDEDTAAVLDWPSRDVGGIATLLRHGLDPLEVIAARPTPARPPGSTQPVIPNGGVLRLDDRTLIRRAGLADLDTVARLGIEVIRFDALFGSVNERPGTLAALREELADTMLTGPVVGGSALGASALEGSALEGSALEGSAPWVWLAERDGQAVAMLAAQRPAAAAWIAPMTAVAPAAYLELMFVDPRERSAGLGRALVDEFHREAAAAGVAVTLLHYEQLNPLSMPFWSRHGYRPLWTTWEVSPGSGVR